MDLTKYIVKSDVKLSIIIIVPWFIIFKKMLADARIYLEYKKLYFMYNKKFLPSAGLTWAHNCFPLTLLSYQSIKEKTKLFEHFL